MKAIKLNEMKKANLTYNELNSALFDNELKKAVKTWDCETKFKNSKEVNEVYEGFQASYTTFSDIKFLFGFKTESGKLFKVYEALNVTLVKEIKLHYSLHNGGCYEITFIKDKENNLCYLFNKNTAYDIEKVRNHQKKQKKQLEMSFVDVYDSSNL